MATGEAGQVRAKATERWLRQAGPPPGLSCPYPSKRIPASAFAIEAWAAQLPQPMHKPERTIWSGLSGVFIAIAGLRQRLLEVTRGCSAHSLHPVGDSRRKRRIQQGVVCGGGRFLRQQMLFAIDQCHQATELVAAIP